MLKPLTSLRFFFALMIFATHLSFFIKETDSEFLWWLYSNIFKEGYIGVSFFFILSGYILTYRYSKEIYKAKIPLKSFYIARLARIYPLHFITFLAAIPLVILEKHTQIGLKSLLQLTLLQSFSTDHQIYFSFNYPSWSISNEMFFYLIFPFASLTVSRLTHLKYKWMLFIIFIATIPLLMLTLPPENHLNLFYICPLLRLFDFILGVILYQLASHAKIDFSKYEIHAILTLILFFSLHTLIPQTARYSVYYWLPMSFIIITFSQQKGAISKFLSHKILISLGEISFSFYLIHQLVIRYFSKINYRLLHIDNKYLIISIVFLISMVASYFSNRLIEKPFSIKIKSITKTQKQ